ncbi:MAG: aryl-sulfate sulfotransferase [Gammaproteobacteria bacterium]
MVDKSPRVFLFLLMALAQTGCDQTDFEPDVPLVLDQLTVSGTKTSLNPTFDPDITRYSVIASDDAQALGVTASANEALTISIDGSIVVSDTPFLMSSVAPGDSITVTIDGRVQSASYEIVYLPADFPELKVTVLEQGASTDPLYVNMNGPTTNYIAVLDNHGVPTFYRGDQERMVDFKWHPATGERSYAQLTGEFNEWGRRDAEHVVLDANFEEIERFTTVDLTHTDLHDLQILDNNELVMVSYDGSLRDMTAFGLSGQEVIEDSVIQIVDRLSKQVLFEWNSWGLVPFEDQTYPEVDGEYAHINSIIEDTDGNLIGSFRGTSQVVKISRPGGQVMWKFGGRTNQFEFINDPYSHLCGQHTASRLANGNILIFDNGEYCWPIRPERGQKTRVVEYAIDEQAMTAELVWSYEPDGIYSRFAGSAQRQPNGNTLMGWGGINDVLATEVTMNGNTVFELTAFHGDTTVVGYRALRFPE